MLQHLIFLWNQENIFEINIKNTNNTSQQFISLTHLNHLNSTITATFLLTNIRMQLMLQKQSSSDFYSVVTVGMSQYQKCKRCSVMEESQTGVNQSDPQLIASFNHNLVSSRARWSCDVLNTTLHADRERRHMRGGQRMQFAGCSEQVQRGKKIYLAGIQL